MNSQNRSNSTNEKLHMDFRVGKSKIKSEEVKQGEK